MLYNLSGKPKPKQNPRPAIQDRQAAQVSLRHSEQLYPSEDPKGLSQGSLGERIRLQTGGKVKRKVNDVLAATTATKVYAGPLSVRRY